jgi:hypothetical protein
MTRQALQVVQHADSWALRFERNELPISLHKTEADAVEVGKRKAKKLGCRLRVDSRNAPPAPEEKQ